MLRCWVVGCKTADCGVLVLAVIGDNDPSKIHFLKRCRDFREMCESCRTKHVYTRADVREENVARRETLTPAELFRKLLNPKYPSAISLSGPELKTGCRYYLPKPCSAGMSWTSRGRIVNLSNVLLDTPGTSLWGRTRAFSSQAAKPRRFMNRCGTLYGQGGPGKEGSPTDARTGLSTRTRCGSLPFGPRTG